MAVQVSNQYPSRQARNAEATKAKERRQKVILGIGGAILLIVLAIELPKTLKEISGSRSTPAATAVAPSPSSAVTPTPTTEPIAGLARLRHLAAKDPFAAQVTTPSANTGEAALTKSDSVTAAGPSVKTKDLVAKDPFVAQVALPAAAAPQATAAQSSAATSDSSADATTASSSSAGGYIIVLASTPAALGSAPADRASVAAKNLGLPNVQIENSQSSKPGSPYTVFTGPYETQAGAQLELVRALRVGYAHAYMRTLPKAASSRGF